ncbi:hypothetical protein B0J18DRAFT_173257 [Chaetomium sp. MPI-SDFR-AT-0129]|nr:hypothetical protein B0J18DRAFT_173257 [Chaetomium sp. MPI-SDFR-AT-0129]
MLDSRLISTMAPSSIPQNCHSWSGPRRRDPGNDCSGWGCLSNAAQFGIILVIVSFVLVVGYLYWRLKIKPTRIADRNGDGTTVNGHWEVTRQDPNRLSIHIYRESRPLGNPKPSRPDRGPPGSSRDDDPNNHKNKALRQFTTASGFMNPLDIHLVPPPPPLPPPFPGYWAPLVPPTVPPPPGADPAAFVQPGPVPAPIQPTYFAPGMATTVPGPPEVPPPYFGYPNPPSFPVQQPPPGPPAAVAPSQAPPHVPPPMAAPAEAPGDTRTGGPHPAPVPETPNLWRRWLSLGTRPRAAGHARTISDTSSTSSRSTSPSPSPPIFPSPVPTSTQARGRNRPSHPSERRRERSPRRYQNDLDRRQSRQPRGDGNSILAHRVRSPSPCSSESSQSSQQTNASLEAVMHHYNDLAVGGRPDTRRSFHNHTRAASLQPEQRRRVSITTPTRIRPSDTVPLADLMHHQRHPPPPPASSRNSAPEPRLRRPSPDIQYPSPERRRPRVSFTLPREVESERSDTNPSSSYLTTGTEESRESSGAWSREAHGSGLSHNHPSVHRGHGHSEQRNREAERRGIADRATRTFYQMRRALRGETSAD